MVVKACYKKLRALLQAMEVVATGGEGGCCQQQPLSLQKVAHFATKGVRICCRGWPSPEVLQAAAVLLQAAAAMVLRVAVVSYSTAPPGSSMLREDDRFFLFSFPAGHLGMWMVGGGSTHVVDMQEIVFGAGC
jgi:hypothetical protein